ncbi:unnamed protein product [Strongylus vulgaris]|uniref:C2H2-type domain-containing protein n=1 Tax=Strongylus vulgaris TaxID=40348 RepID=A0A3P7IHR3_STRVU|nr:unnamed protein product [Strongylus vulgaris]
MSDDEGRLLIDDIQDGSGSMDHDFSSNTLVDAKSAQDSPLVLGDAENTAINKLSTPLTVPVFGQPQVTSSGDVHFHAGSVAQRIETNTFPFASNFTKILGEQESPAALNSSPSKHKSKGRGDALPPRKRKDSSFDEQNLPESDSDETVTKKSRPQTRDRGTCVHSRAVQSDTDTSFFDLEVGSTRLVEMTVMCKMENNELYVTVKWKDQEMSGVLTDGRSPAYNPYMKKRQALVTSGSNSSNNSASSEGNERASNSGASTPSKHRQQPTTPRDTKKRSMPSDAKRKLSCIPLRPGVSAEPQDDDEDLDVESCVGGSSSNTDTFKLFEVPGRKSMHICPFEGCQHRYSRGEEMEYHKATAHAKRAVMYEAICCQTDISALRRRSVQTDVEGLIPEEPPCPSTVIDVATMESTTSALSTAEMKVEDPQPSKSPAGYSDISDDGVAPQLQKEEPTNDVHAPLLISTTLPTTTTSEPANVLTSPEFAPSPKERDIAPESVPSTPQQSKTSRPSSMPVAPATPTAPQSCFQPVSVDRNRSTVNGTGVSPVMNCVGTPTPISAISASTRLPVTPAPTGVYMSSFAHQMMSPFTPTQFGAAPTANPVPSPQQQSLSKLAQSHLKPDDVTSPSGVLSSAKTMQSPAAQNMQRQFGLQLMQSGTGQHQAAMMQAAAAQTQMAQMAQMHHLYMQQMAAGARGAQFPVSDLK